MAFSKKFNDVYKLDKSVASIVIRLIGVYVN